MGKRAEDIFYTLSLSNRVESKLEREEVQKGGGWTGPPRDQKLEEDAEPWPREALGERKEGQCRCVISEMQILLAGPDSIPGSSQGLDL